MSTVRTLKNLCGALASHLRENYSKRLPPRMACSALFRNISNRAALPQATSMDRLIAPTVKSDWKRIVSGTRAYSNKPNPEEKGKGIGGQLQIFMN